MTVSNKLLNELDKIDSKLEYYLENDFMSQILEPAILEVQNAYLEELNETIDQKQLRVLKKSKSLYQSIKTSSIKTSEWLIHLLKTIDKGVHL